VETYENAMIDCDVWSEFVCPSSYVTIATTLDVLERCSDSVNIVFQETKERNNLLLKQLARRN
jgi:predicted DsbA family dithiol-disulfide isomerase